MTQSEKLVRLRQGLDAEFGGSRVGVVLVRADEAILSVRQRDASHRVQMTVRPGELMAIPLGATANAAGFDVEVLTLEPDATAKLEVWPDEFAKPQTKPQLIKAFAVKGGASIPAGARQLSIVSVVPPNASTGLRGFVELGWRA
ncbi:MAG: hypothetical protein ACOZQL_20820 [Myxococcota bacterium]